MTLDSDNDGFFATRWRPFVVAAAIGLVVIVALAIASAGDDVLSVPEALLLGVIEGVTEFLPVSSTGHLTVTQRLMGLTDTEAGKAAADSYAIAIQFGAIVAVAGLYRTRITNVVVQLVRPGDRNEAAVARSLATALAVAFTPAAIVGLAAGDAIKTYLFGLWPTVVAWFAGGVVIIVFARRHRAGERALEVINARDGLLIGAAQVLALWPGVSRSLVTILAALLIGLRMDAAVEFSFLLGLATLSAATIYESATNGSEILDQYGALTPFIGFLAAFVSAAIAVVWMVGYLQRHSLAIFGWYRIVLAVVVAVLGITVL